MVHFKEIPGKVIETIENLIEQAKAKKLERASRPEFIASIERMRNSRSQDFEKACDNGKEAGLSFLYGTLKLIGSPLYAPFAMGKEAIDVWKHNDAEDPDNELRAINKIKDRNKEMLEDPKTVRELRTRREILSTERDLINRRQSYWRVPAAPVVNILKDYKDGIVSTTKMIKDLTVMAARSGAIKSRETIGY